MNSLATERRNYIPNFVGVTTLHISDNLSFNCSFTISPSGTVQITESECFIPLIITIKDSEPTHPAVVYGGDMIKVCLELTPLVLPGEQLTFFLDNFHPALLLIDHVFTSDNRNATYTNMVNVHSSENASTLLVGNITLALREVLQACIIFRVQSYVLPRASLYFSFKVYYFIHFYSGLTFVQSYSFFDEYSSGDITHGSLSLILPSYAAEDHLENTYPPHVGDLFFIDIPILVPCISTDINLTLTLPEFTSEVYTMFFTNITDILITPPKNLVYISKLCNYNDPSNFISSSCDIENVQIVNHIPTLTEEGYGPGSDKIYIYLPPILYNMTGIEGCILNSSIANCTCPAQELTVSLKGHVANVSDMFCGNQTLADNITNEYEYAHEITTFSDFDSVPTIVFTTLSDDFVFAVNASSPAISVPINSFRGDAGDEYNLTFSILHNKEYSSFTAYDLNYTFSIDLHLQPNKNVTICYSNASNASICEIVPFINNTIIRDGFHPM